MINEGAIITTSKRQLLAQKYVIQRIARWIGPSLSCAAQPFTHSPQILCFTMLFNQSDTPKVLLPGAGGASTRHVVHVPWTHHADLSSQTAFRSVQPFLHSSRQRVLPILYNVRWNAINARFKKNKNRSAAGLTALCTQYFNSGEHAFS